MNAKEIAEKLNGIEYPPKIPKELLSEAKSSGVVIVYGYSDDLTEFEGAIIEELDAYDGATHWLCETGLYPANICEDNCPYYKHPNVDRAIPLEAVWCGPSGASWEFNCDVPHETFKIMESGDVYCIGIVFDISDLRDMMKGT